MSRVIQIEGSVLSVILCALSGLLIPYFWCHSSATRTIDQHTFDVGVLPRNASSITIKGPGESVDDNHHYEESLWYATTENGAFSDRRQQHFKVTIVVHPWSEMGNWLFYTIMGKVVEWKLSKEHGIQSNVVIVQPPHPKQKRTRRTLNRCFPEYRRKGFVIDSRTAAGTIFHPVFKEIEAVRQNELPGVIEPRLRQIADLARASAPVAAGAADQGEKEPRSHTILLHVRSFFVPLQWVDEFYDEIKKEIQFDYSACCNRLPETTPKEHVYHFRNFAREFAKGGRQDPATNGWTELTPNQAAVDLWGHLPKRDKNGPTITVLSRYANSESFAQVQALQDLGYPNARLMHNQSGVNDFCYLLSAQGEIAGMARSTFYKFASLWGKSSTSWWIAMDAPGAREKLGEWWDFRHNWTHPLLKDRIRHRIFLPE